MVRWISQELRQTIANRANFLCEYCLLEFNNSARFHEREEMIRFGKYPGEAALMIMAG
jgi:molybdenum cofactor biosynthesis enzyme MoaA